MRGRVRLRLNTLKSRPGLATQLQEHLRSVPGIRRVEVNSRTGSVLLAYDPHALESPHFLDDVSATMGKLFPAHFAPGRVRITVDLLKGRPKLAHKIQQQLEAVAGIHRLEIDPSDGVCLFVYDSRTVTSPEFIDAVSRPLAALLPQINVKEIIARTGLGSG